MPPLNRYFDGRGKKVMRDMKKRYGKRGEVVFYRTANARKKKKKQSGSDSGYGRSAQFATSRKR